MDRTMSLPGALALHVRVLAARTLQFVGWTGVAGVALMLAASAIVAVAWTQRPARTDVVIAAPAKPVQALPGDGAANLPPLQYSDMSEVPLLVTQIAQAANANGLSWPAAEYRILAATQEKPSSLEVRCVLRGSYPRVRSMLGQLISGVAGFSLRELSMSRPSSEVAEVEAKLVMAVFLRDGAPSQASRQQESER